MPLDKKIRELQEKREKILLGGGEQAIEKQKALGKRTARERIMALLDEGSGNIYGAPVAIFAQDFTVAGGSLGLMHSRKITKIMDHALKMKNKLKCKIRGKIKRIPVKKGDKVAKGTILLELQ